jgi:hypothetical protein
LVGWGERRLEVRVLVAAALGEGVHLGGLYGGFRPTVIFFSRLRRHFVEIFDNFFRILVTLLPLMVFSFTFAQFVVLIILYRPSSWRFDFILLLPIRSRVMWGILSVDILSTVVIRVGGDIIICVVNEAGGVRGGYPGWFG